MGVAELGLQRSYPFEEVPTRILAEELSAVTDELARVITDDLSNSYQKVE